MPTESDNQLGAHIASDRPVDLAGVVREIGASLEARFRRAEMLRSFEEYLEEVFAHPARCVRGSARYLLDAVEHFGHEDRRFAGETVRRYRVFDAPTTDGVGEVRGQERAQAELVQRIKDFADKGRVDKLLMLHGPNGSGKTTIVECLVRGLEAYSQTDEGALYRFSWMFSEALERDHLGFAEAKAARRTDTYAYLEPEEVTARIPCDLKDSPLLLIPMPEREDLLVRAFARAGLPEDAVPRRILQADLCHKCREIYSTLLQAYQGDWTRVVQHVQVERFFVSRRYREGFASIEPQRNVDAGLRVVSADASKSLPQLLQNSTLYEPIGSLIAANRGLVEYSDFFKRPLEVNKYLLTTVEKGTISLAHTTPHLDLVMVATANEKNLCLARRDPDFGSFTGRFERIPVPYLLNVTKEAAIYEAYLETLGREKHVAPHVARTAALWAVLTRLRRPRAKNYPGALGALIGRLSPLQKATLYDRAEPPAQLKDKEKRELVAEIARIRREFDEAEEELEGVLDAAYEGRRGASPREMHTVLADAAALRDFPCLTPQAVIAELRELVKDVSAYDFLRLTPHAGYNDAPKLIDDCEGEYLRWLREDTEHALDLVSAAAYEKRFEDYFVHVRAYVRGERVRNPQTAELGPPDEALLTRVERALDREVEADDHRKALVTRIAVWSIDHPGEAVDTRTVFDDVYQALRREAYQERGQQIQALLRQALTIGTDDFALLRPSEQEQITTVVSRMEAKGYCRRCAKEAFATVLQHLRA